MLKLDALLLWESGIQSDDVDVFSVLLLNQVWYFWKGWESKNKAPSTMFDVHLNVYIYIYYIAMTYHDYVG